MARYLIQVSNNAKGKNSYRTHQSTVEFNEAIRIYNSLSNFRRRLMKIENKKRYLLIKDR